MDLSKAVQYTNGDQPNAYGNDYNRQNHRIIHGQILVQKYPFYVEYSFKMIDKDSNEIKIIDQIAKWQIIVIGEMSKVLNV